jgi:hypothetical protein
VPGPTPHYPPEFKREAVQPTAPRLFTKCLKREVLEVRAGVDNMRGSGLSYRFISDRSCSAASGGNMDKAVLVTSSERSRAASALSLPTPPT